MTIGRTARLTATEDVRFIEKDLALYAGETISYQVEYVGVSSLSAVTFEVFRKKKDITSDVTASAVGTVSGNIATLEPITPLTTDGRKKYELSVTATVDGDTRIRNGTIKILRVTDTL